MRRRATVSTMDIVATIRPEPIPKRPVNGSQTSDHHGQFPSRRKASGRRILMDIRANAGHGSRGSSAGSVDCAVHSMPWAIVAQTNSIIRNEKPLNLRFRRSVRKPCPSHLEPPCLLPCFFSTAYKGKTPEKRNSQNR